MRTYTIKTLEWSETDDLGFIGATSPWGLSYDILNHHNTLLKDGTTIERWIMRAEEVDRGVVRFHIEYKTSLIKAKAAAEAHHIEQMEKTLTALSKDTTL